MMEPFEGRITLFAGNYAPEGWALCDGQLLSIAKNTSLFTIIGATYGGDGRTTFALPRLAPLGPNGPHYLIAVTGEYPSRV
jgi:microcystin-dependent protein